MRNATWPSASKVDTVFPSDRYLALSILPAFHLGRIEVLLFLYRSRLIRDAVISNFHCHCSIQAHTGRKAAIRISDRVGCSYRCLTNLHFHMIAILQQCKLTHRLEIIVRSIHRLHMRIPDMIAPVGIRSPLNCSYMMAAKFVGMKCKRHSKQY